MELLGGLGAEWQSFDDVDLASESVPSVLSGSFGKQESADDLVSLPDVSPATAFPTAKHNWNTNEEVAAVLMAFDHHDQWLHRQLTTRPFSGSMFLYNRKEIKFRQDGYMWKTGKKGKLREDHMKLKIGGVSCIYGLYAHSSLLSTFHRRCYWLLARPNIILVHYLNVIPKDDAIKLSIGPVCGLSSASSSSTDNLATTSPPSSSSLTRDAVLQQLCPMFGLPFPMHSNGGVSSLLSPSQQDEESPIAMQQRFERLCQLVDVAIPSRQPQQTTTATTSTAPVSAESAAVVHTFDSYGSSPSTSMLSHRMIGNNLGQHTSTRNIMPKSSAVDVNQQPENSSAMFQQSQQQQQYLNGNNNLVNHGMPPPPPPSIPPNSHYSGNASVRSNKRPLDPNAGMFADEMHLASDGGVYSNTANSQQSSCGYVFWNQSQLQHVQQPQHYHQQQQTHPLQQQRTYFSFGSTEQETSPALNARRISSSATCTDPHAHDNLSSAYSAPPTCVQSLGHQLSSSSAMSLSGKEDGSNAFSSFASSGNEPEILFPSFEFSSSEVEELLQYNPPSPMQQSMQSSLLQQHGMPQSSSSSSLSSMMIMDHQPHVQLQVQTTEHHHQQQQQEQSNLCGHQHHMAPTSSNQVTQYSIDSRIDASVEFSLIRIKDIAPQSAFVRGGIKVLIAGRWPANCRSITVAFGKITVPASVLQPGLLKCYCPAVSQPGAVDLVVCCDGVVRSNPSTFYYRRQNQSSQSGDANLSPRGAQSLLAPASPGACGNGSNLQNNGDVAMMSKLQLLELLQQLKETLKPCMRLGFDVILRSCSQHMSCNSAVSSASTTELLAVAIFAEIISNLPPPDPSLTQTVQSVDANNWTVLHFAAALGYTMLVEYMLDLLLQSKLPPVVEQQADVEARDAHGSTPLHVACSKGQTNTAISLFRRAPHLIASLNTDGLNPVGMAAAAGHYDLVRVMQAHEDSYLNHLESASMSFRGGVETTPSSLSQSLVTFIGGNSRVDGEHQDETAMAASSSASGAAASGSSGLSTGFSEATSNTMWPYDATSQHMFDLANHIIAALPERIKQIPSTAYLQPLPPTLVAPPVMSAASASCSDAFVVYRERSASHGSHAAGMGPTTTPLGDSGLSTPLSFSFEAPDSNSSPQQQQQMSGSGSVRHRSPPPTPEQFNEYFNAPSVYLHHDFSHLTLSDDEQRRLYEAARVIQQAYRRYRESKHVPATSASTSRQNSAASHSQMMNVQIAQDQVLGILLQHDRFQAMQEFQRQQQQQQQQLQQQQQQQQQQQHQHQQQQKNQQQQQQMQRREQPTDNVVMLASPLHIALSSAAANSVPSGGSNGVGSGISSNIPVASNNTSEILTEPAAGDDRTVEVEQAALVIQAYYRRYKQFVAYRKMTEAATVIQSQFRSYSAQKRFRQSRDAARVIQNQYRMYRATNQRRGTLGPFRSSSNAGMIAAARRRSGSASSSSSIAGLGSTSYGKANGPVFMQSHNSCELIPGAAINDPFLKMDTWNKRGMLTGTASTSSQHQQLPNSKSNNIGPVYHNSEQSSICNNNQGTLLAAAQKHNQQQQQQHQSQLQQQQQQSGASSNSQRDRQQPQQLHHHQ